MNVHSPNKFATAVYRSQPLSDQTRVIMLPRDRTIAELVELAITQHGLSTSFRHSGDVRVGGEVIPREYWPRVRLRQDKTSIISFHHKIAGSGSGQGKNPLLTIALIAVLITATLVSGGLLGGVFAAGTISAQLAGTALLIGGSLAIGALSRPPVVAAADSQAVTDNEGRAASLSGNVLVPGAPIPRVLGTNRVFPPLACQPLVDLVGDIEYVEGVYVLTGPHTLTSPRAADSDLDDVPRLTYELSEGLGTRQNLVTRYGRTKQAQVELSLPLIEKTTQYRLTDQITPENSLQEYHTFASYSSPDEIWFRLVWPEGLFSDTDTTITWQQPVRIRFRQRGEVTWNNAPEIHFSSNKLGLFQKDIRFQWGTCPTFRITPPVDQGPILAYKHVDAQEIAAGIVSTDWDAHSSFSAGAGNDRYDASTESTTSVANVELREEKVIFWLDAATFPQTSKYEFQIKLGQAYNESKWAPTTYKYDPPSGGGKRRYDFFYYFPENDEARVLEDVATVHQRVVVKTIATVINDNPIQSDDFATISVVARGIQVNDISVVASGYTYDWDGAGWNTLTTSSNPAPHFREVLAGALNADRVHPDAIDDDTIAEWRTHCVNKGYQVNLICDGRSVWDVLGVVASCGYGRPRQSETWSVAWDRDRAADPVVTLFSPSNLSNFRLERAFVKRTTGLRVRIRDRDDDYRETEPFIVYDPTNADADDSRLEEVFYDGLTSIDEATGRAEYDLSQPSLRFIYAYGASDLESFVCTKGDLVGVQHDTLTRSSGSSRILSLTMNSSEVIGLELQGSIPVPSTSFFTDADSEDFFDHSETFFRVERTGIAIRLEDGTLLIKEVTAATDDDSTLTFVEPFIPPADMVAGCLLTSGELGLEYRRMIVFGITYSSDRQANLVFIPEAPSLWGPPTAKALAVELGLTDGLVICLDAGDGNSFTSGQRWLDTSGEDNDFYFGINDS